MRSSRSAGRPASRSEPATSINSPNDSTGATTEYEWDYRNRLVSVTDKDSLGATTQLVAYVYDVFNRRIGRAVDTTSPFDLDDALVERYILDDASGVASLDGGNVILDFVDPDGPGGAADLELAKRYLYGPAVDQILAQEDVTETLTSDDRVWWPLGDHLQTTRDLVDQTGASVEHYQYDSYGQVTSGDPSLTRYLFTAREFDDAAGLQYNWARWYDANAGRWSTYDPMVFKGRDINPVRYVTSHVTSAIDPSGYRKPNPTSLPVPLFPMEFGNSLRDLVVKSRLPDLTMKDGTTPFGYRENSRNIGFDCDDYALVMSTYLKNSLQDIDVNYLHMQWIGNGHTMVNVSHDDRKYLIDPPTGNVTGPHQTYGDVYVSAWQIMALRDTYDMSRPFLSASWVKDNVNLPMDPPSFYEEPKIFMAFLEALQRQGVKDTSKYLEGLKPSPSPSQR